MPRLYSPEWLAAFNEAVGGASPGQAGDTDDGSPPAGGCSQPAGGSYRVAQVVTGGPEGDVRVVLEVAGDRLRLEREDPDAPGDADVTVVVAYGDAAAMARGATDAAAMVRAGRVKVRGNLSMLMASQALLAAAADRLAPVSASTTV
ncbi:MAG: SCP2 sterol-binding domain-containing protein [Acidimicrobiales bacterium]